MGFIQYVKNFHFWSSDSRDIQLNNLAPGPGETAIVICLRCLASKIFWQLHFQELSFYRY